MAPHRSPAGTANPIPPCCAKVRVIRSNRLLSSWFTHLSQPPSNVPCAPKVVRLLLAPSTAVPSNEPSRGAHWPYKSLTCSIALSCCRHIPRLAGSPVADPQLARAWPTKYSPDKSVHTAIESPLGGRARPTRSACDRDGARAVTGWGPRRSNGHAPAIMRAGLERSALRAFTRRAVLLAPVAGDVTGYRERAASRCEAPSASAPARRPVVLDRVGRR